MSKAFRNKKKILFTFLPILLIAIVGGFLLFKKSNFAFASKNTCPTLAAPTDLSLVTAVLYPGQYRGGQYKAHGGFRLDRAPNNNVTVTAPLAAKLADASQYIEQGEVQYILDFQTSCGLKYRFDHLRTLAPRFASALNSLPAPENENSMTHTIHGNVAVTQGETVATAVGFIGGDHGPNVSFDFGVYDRITNEASKNPSWYSLHKNDSQATHGLCWFDLLSPNDAALVRSLPAGDYKSGKTSDYCK